MKSWYLWVGLALLALLLLSVREGFSATATIKDPATWDTTEFDRIRKLVTPESTVNNSDIRMFVGGFWSKWTSATSRLTTADVDAYMETMVQKFPAAAGGRSALTALIVAYYITQGQSVFLSASGYSAEVPGVTPTPPPSTDTTTTTTTIERPSTSTQSLRQEIATTYGITTSQTAVIDFVIGKVQSFYDTVYLPDKTTPTYTQMMGFADAVDMTTVPSSVGNNFKTHLVEVLQSYFTPQTGVSGAEPPSSVSAGPAAGDTAGATGEAGGWTGAAGKNVQGPDSGGRGTADNTTGGLGVPRNYPVLYGGMQSYESALPSSKSLGTDPTSKFLPYSRVPGDQDLYPDPYRLGKYFSTSSYSSGKDVPEPAPFLADFSKFFT